MADEGVGRVTALQSAIFDVAADPVELDVSGYPQVDRQRFVAAYFQCDETFGS